MKKLIFLALFGLIIGNNANSQYSFNRKIFDPGDYVYQPDDPYNPSTARKLSYSLPGLGHVHSGEFVRGVPFMIGGLAFAGMGSYGLAMLFFELVFSSMGENVEGTPHLAYFLVGLGGMVGLAIWSANDAEKVAKVNNLVWRAKNQPTVSLSVEPCLASGFNLDNKHSIAPGLSLKIKF